MAGNQLHCWTCTTICNTAFLDCRRYERANKPVSAFEADILKFRDLSEEVLAEDAATSMRFLRLDCGPLKQVGSTAQAGVAEVWHPLSEPGPCRQRVSLASHAEGPG